MESQPNKRQTLSDPKDRSLEAYKAWFMEIVKRLTKVGTEIKWTEEEWITSWKECWKEQANR